MQACVRLAPLAFRVWYHAEVVDESRSAQFQAESVAFDLAQVTIECHSFSPELLETWGLCAALMRLAVVSSSPASFTLAMWDSNTGSGIDATACQRVRWALICPPRRWWKGRTCRQADDRSASVELAPCAVPLRAFPPLAACCGMPPTPWRSRGLRQMQRADAGIVTRSNDSFVSESCTLIELIRCILDGDLARGSELLENPGFDSDFPRFRVTNSRGADQHLARPNRSASRHA